MRRVAIRTADVVAPVLTTPEIVVLFLARVARETSLGNFFRRFVLERNDLCRIAFFRVSLARAMTGLTPRNLSFPTADSC